MQTNRNRVLAKNMFALAAGSVALGLGLYSSASGATISTTIATWTGSGGDGLWATAGNWSNGDYVDSAHSGTYTGIPGTDQDIDIGNNGQVYYYNVGSSSTQTTVPFPSGYTTSGALTIEQGSSLLAIHGQIVLSVDGGYNSTASTGVAGAQTGLNNAGILGCTANGASWGIALGGSAGQSASTYASTNTGTIMASSGGTFSLSESTASAGLNNTGGTIEAISSTTSIHSTLTLGGGTSGGPKIAGGNLLISQYSNLNITNSFSSATLNGVNFNNAGTMSVNENPGSSAASYVIAQTASTFTNTSTGTGNFRFYGTNNAATVGLAIGGATLTNYRLVAGAADASTFSNSGTMTFENSSAQTGATSTTVELDLNTNGPAASAITNSGTINFKTDGTTAFTNPSAGIRLGNSATINGTGALTFNDAATNFVEEMNGTTSNPTLTLGAGQTLSGAVLLGNGQIGIDNQGTVYANGKNPIVISTAGGTGANFTNTGTLKVDSTSTINDTDASLTLSTGSNVTVQIDSSSVAGDVGTSGVIDGNLLDLGTGSTLTVTDLPTFTTNLGSGVVFTLMDFSSIVPGETFTNYANGSTLSLNGNNYTVNYDYAAGDVTLTSFVPEPASVSLLALGALGLLRRRRREIA